MRIERQPQNKLTLFCKTCHFCLKFQHAKFETVQQELIYYSRETNDNDSFINILNRWLALETVHKASNTASE